MKNYEKYADEIREYKGCNFCVDFVCQHILKIEDCDYIGCSRCNMLQMLWLLEDYKEPEVDWNKVEVNTPILVRDYESQEWEARHFAKYEDGVVYTWDGGSTSWTSRGNVTEWKYAKLAEDEKECKEPEVDWSEVEVGTPILVKHDECDKWSYRYFAKYENGVVYAWDCGRTSWTGDGVTEWKYAKLAESEE